MHTEGRKNDVFAAHCERDHSYSAIVGAFYTADQSFFGQPIHGHADGAGSQVNFRPNRIHWQRALMEKRLKHAEVRVGDSCLLDSSSYSQTANNFVLTAG